MKTFITCFLLMSGSLIFINCTSDNELSDLSDPILQRNPADEFSLGPQGFPRLLEIYRDGQLEYSAQYYFRPDGNLLKVNYWYSGPGNGSYTDIYNYDSKGRLVSVLGHDEYKFYWDDDRIVEADKYNGMWHGNSKILYEYNEEGQLIQRTENNIDFSFSEKILISYFEDGNIKSLANYSDDDGSGEFILYQITSFDGYTNNKNLFPELVMIPGQLLQYNFPVSMSFEHLASSGYDLHEIYEYKYDEEGRVSEKIFGKDMIVYHYY